MKPGYKQTEVGVFPADWDIAQLGNVADVEGGFAFSSKAFLGSGTYQVIKMSNLYGGSLDLERSASFLNELTEQERHYLLRPNHIILTLTGTTGKRDYGYSYLVTHEQNLLLNQRVARVVVTENSCAGYVSLQLQSPCFLNQFFEVSKGGTGNQTNVGTQDVAAMRIPVPSLPEQRAIATALKDVDGLLGALDRLIAKKRDLKQAAMQQLLTGQTRLPGFKGEWEVKTVAELEKLKLVKLSRGQVISKKDIDRTPGDYPIYSSSIHNDGLFGRYGYFMFDEELITWSVDGGGNFFHRRKHRFSVTNVCGFMRVDTSQIDCRFFAAELQLLHSRKNFDYQSKAHPSVIRKEYEVQLPPLPEQTAIASVLSEMDAELAGLEQRREKTRSLKQGMMQELLTGRTRLVD